MNMENTDIEGDKSQIEGKLQMVINEGDGDKVDASEKAEQVASKIDSFPVKCILNKVEFNN
jgi:hypothetical protein